MVLKLTVHIRNVISLSSKPKTDRTFLANFSILAYISLKIGYFELGYDYDVTLALLVLILVCLERGDPSYTMVPITCILEVSFSSSQGAGTTPPLW